MKENQVIRTLLNHKSIRRFKPKSPTMETIRTIVRAGQQAPFSSQVYSVLLSRNLRRNPFKAPLLFTICIDFHKLQLIMKKKNWELVSSDLFCLLMGIQDASLMAENMSVAAESLGLGICFLGNTPLIATAIAKEYKLPKRVFPLTQIAMGYPAENPPTRPRYPLEFVLFEKEYPKFWEKDIKAAMKKMDQGYLAQNYYRKINFRVPLEKGRKEKFTFDNYSWTEHISRKWGQWNPSPKKLLEQLSRCGFDINK
ncbi:MAG TPA: nitroreductase family protein [Terriglobales bacterium]|nr:nitroreductase family protein [Terriglobales bacterium]